MGLFDKLSSKDEKVKLTKEEAFAAVSLATIVADGTRKASGRTSIHFRSDNGGRGS
jgi:hypothetical protein